MISATPCARPSCIPRARNLRGTKALGIGFEKAFAKALPAAVHGQWFEYEEGKGKKRYCQTDFLLFSPEKVVVIEAKLTRWQEAEDKIRNLYSPVVERAFGLPVKAVILLRHATHVPAGHKIHDDLAAAIEENSLLPSVFQWLGHGPVSSRPLCPPFYPKVFAHGLKS